MFLCSVSKSEKERRKRGKIVLGYDIFYYLVSLTCYYAFKRLCVFKHENEKRKKRSLCSAFYSFVWFLDPICWAIFIGKSIAVMWLIGWVLLTLWTKLKGDVPSHFLPTETVDNADDMFKMNFVLTEWRNLWGFLSSLRVILVMHHGKFSKKNWSYLIFYVFNLN